MPVDPNALLDAIADGLAKIPSGIFAAILLGGPTLVWLVLRLTHPPEPRSRYGPVSEDLHWICAQCRSINERRLSRCYHCHAGRVEIAAPLLADGAVAGFDGVGIPVGPGLPDGPPPDDWLDDALDEDGIAAAAGDARDEELENVPAQEAVPAEDPVPAAVGVARSDVPPVFEPLLLEPKAPAPRRPSRARRTDRR